MELLGHLGHLGHFGHFENVLNPASLNRIYWSFWSCFYQWFLLLVDTIVVDSDKIAGTVRDWDKLDNALNLSQFIWASPYLAPSKNDEDTTAYQVGGCEYNNPSKIISYLKSELWVLARTRFSEALARIPQVSCGDCHFIWERLGRGVSDCHTVSVTQNTDTCFYRICSPCVVGRLSLHLGKIRKGCVRLSHC